MEELFAALSRLGRGAGPLALLPLAVPFAAFAAAFAASLGSARARRAQKRWFLYLSAGCCLLSFALAAPAASAPGAPAALAAAGMAADIALYGLLHLPRGRRQKEARAAAESRSPGPRVPGPPPPRAAGDLCADCGEEPVPEGSGAPASAGPADCPPPKVCCFEGEGVRLEQDVRLGPVTAAAERLRSLPLGAGDRLEVQKYEELLRVYRAKGVLSAAEADTLNDIFASFLKLLAKYGA